MGNVFWDNGSDIQLDGDTTPTVSDSHHIDPQLGSNDRPLSSSPLRGVASAYAAYLPRTDFNGKPRTSADAGAFDVP